MTLEDGVSLSLARGELISSVGYLNRSNQHWTMSTRDRTHLRRVKRIWQSRQESAGITTLFLAVVTSGALLEFAFAPSRQVVALVAGLLVLLTMACAFLVGSAAKVVEIRETLRPAQNEADPRRAAEAAANRRHPAAARPFLWDRRN